MSGSLGWQAGSQHAAQSHGRPRGSVSARGLSTLQLEAGSSFLQGRGRPGAGVAGRPVSGTQINCTFGGNPPPGFPPPGKIEPLVSRSRSRGIYSERLRGRTCPRAAYSEFPDDWFEGLTPKAYRGRVYTRAANKYGVKAGQDQAFWEGKGWIAAQDPRGWFQWYCRFYQGGKYCCLYQGVWGYCCFCRGGALRRYCRLFQGGRRTAASVEVGGLLPLLPRWDLPRREVPPLLSRGSAGTVASAKGEGLRRYCRFVCRGGGGMPASYEAGRGPSWQRRRQRPWLAKHQLSWQPGWQRPQLLKARRHHQPCNAPPPPPPTPPPAPPQHHSEASPGWEGWRAPH